MYGQHGVNLCKFMLDFGCKKDMFLCQLLQGNHGGLLKFHLALTGARILYLYLSLTFL